LWQDEIEGELCNVILYAHSNVTDYYWFSVKTGLPRASQRVNMARPPAVLTHLFLISDVRFDPTISPDAFELRPTPARTEAPTKPEPAASEANPSGAGLPVPDLNGQPLPDLELRDPQYKAVRLPDLKGKPTLVTFWAPWCGPCLAELEALEKLRTRFKDRFQVVAIAVKDKRLNAIEFIQAHPQYKFLFFTDPDIDGETSRLASFFGLDAIPVSVLVDSQGKIVERWTSFTGEKDLAKMVQKLLKLAGS
jgi:thiol-disulfide isomerase/thioredoxin